MKLKKRTIVLGSIAAVIAGVWLTFFTPWPINIDVDEVDKLTITYHDKTFTLTPEQTDKFLSLIVKSKKDTNLFDAK